MRTRRRPKAGRRTAARRRPKLCTLQTVRVPAPIEPVFARAQRHVARYFRDKTEDPEVGTISISGERHILLRAASMSVEFFDLVTSLYEDKAPQTARGVASNLLFDVVHAIGKADARAFQQRLGLHDPIEKLSAGPIHFSYSGWAFVDIFPAPAGTRTRSRPRPPSRPSWTPCAWSRCSRTWSTTRSSTAPTAARSGSRCVLQPAACASWWPTAASASHRERRLGGMGLGLYISRQIVDLHGGAWTRHSRIVKLGTEVVVHPASFDGGPLYAEYVSANVPDPGPSPH